MIEHKEKTMTYDVEILASDRHTNVAGLNQSMGSHPSLQYINN
jgi:hypothetical protein